MYKRQSLKEKSYKTIKNRIENHILPFFKDYDIKNITAKDYIEFKDYILSKKLSYKYCSSIHVAAVNIFNYACNFYNLKENVASKIGNFSNKEYIKKYNIWTIDEFKLFIDNVAEIEYKTLFFILYNTGIRIGEALALTWNDIENDSINISKTYIGYQNGKYIFNTPKTKSSNRTIKLDDYSIKYLNNLKLFFSNTIGFNNEWYVFGGIRPLSTTTIERKKNYYCKKANVKQIKIHEFRHSHATLLLSNGLPITLISKRLGHSNISMTLDTYSHCIPQDEDKAINLLNNLNKKIDF